jgi:putative hydrolase of the HAD superfamily
MTPDIELVLFDIGGVLGTNGWDREQRAAAVARFGLEGDDFQYRHEETIGDLESGRITLDEYLDVTIFYAQRPFAREEFKAFMFAQSEPWPESIAVARELATKRRVRLATLNNESAELNEHRISLFGLREIFPTFFSSCWLGARKPTTLVYKRAFGMSQADPARTLFIDDRVQNLAPAAAMGVRVILFKDAGGLRRELAEVGVL